MNNNLKPLFSSKKDNWRTPPELFRELDDQFHFTLDACADDKNHLCAKYYTIENSCLDHSWRGETVFINPPYGRNIGKIVKKAYDEHFNGVTTVALLPVRTDTEWFHDYIYNKLHVSYKFLKGRIKFYDENGEGKYSAPFPSMLVIWWRTEK